MDYSLPGSSIHGILQARILAWVAISFSRGEVTAAANSLQSCLTLCDPIDGSPPGSHIPGILQARVLEWGAIAFSKLSPYKVQKMKDTQSYLQRASCLREQLRKNVFVSGKLRLE